MRTIPWSNSTSFSRPTNSLVTSGSQFEYSNLGGGLLGNVLARRAGMDYETLVRSRITGPLNMTSTGITLSPGTKTRLAVGHNDKLKAPVPNWDVPVLAVAVLSDRAPTISSLSWPRISATPTRHWLRRWPRC